MTHDTRRSRRPTSAAHALEEAGVFLARQVLSREGVLRKARDHACRQKVAALRELRRPHVFPDRASRDAACRDPLPDGVFALRPTTADAQRAYSDGGCPFGVGPQIGQRGFQTVAAFIVDHEVRKIVDRCESDDFGVVPEHPSSRSVVLAVSSAYFQLRFVERGRAEVASLTPFGGLPPDEVTKTVAWILRRAGARQSLN